MCLTPGPNVVLVTACAVNFGFRSTVPQILGITLGFGVMILAAGLGLAGLLQAAPQLHDWFKYAGIAYLLYLAWRIAGANAAGSKAGRARPINFCRGGADHLAEPERLGDDAGCAGGLHDGNGKRAGANLDRRGGAGDRLRHLGHDMGSVRDCDFPPACNTAPAQDLQPVDGGVVDRIAAAGFLPVSDAAGLQAAKPRRKGISA